MKKRPTILITGATGFVGSGLVSHFAAQGWKVIALARNPVHPATKNVSYVTYDLGREFDDAIFKGADYLVHAAYMKYDSRHTDAMAINVTAAERLLAASRKHGLKKNVFLSTMSAHSGAESVYGRQKLAIEKLFNTQSDVVLRSGLVVGNGGIVKEMTDFMRSKHVVPLIDGGRQPLQVIALYDLVSLIEKALASRFSGSYTVATPRVYSYKEFYRTLAQSLQLRVLFIPLPFNLLILAIRLIRLLHLPLAVSEDNALGLKNLRAADNAKDLKKLGVRLDELEDILANTKLPAR